VGYTNAGKSTLLNALTGASVLVENQLFATLDPTTRRCTLPSNREVLFTDTVGFIQKLPTDLVAAFRATLEEITESDLILHIVDVTHPHAQAQISAVEKTLQELDVVNVPRLMALNKIDRLGPKELSTLKGLEHAVPISARVGTGLEELLVHVDRMLYEQLSPVHVKLPYSAGDLIAAFHEQGSVEQIQHLSDGVDVVGYLPARLLASYRRYIVGNLGDQSGRE
jgi:GTP-binding protein HflX